jgi:two-component system, OmpR family, response regulator AdeR
MAASKSGSFLPPISAAGWDIGDPVTPFDPRGRTATHESATPGAVDRPLLCTAHMADRKPTILISDDEPNLVTALSREARRVGLEPIADTTSNVVTLARECHPDVILLDLHQRIDGRDLLADLKRDPTTKDVKVIVLSAEEDQFTRHTCLELGAADYEVKPFDPTFLRRVLRLVNDNEAAPAAISSPESCAAR